jgi:hypothetical protein
MKFEDNGQCSAQGLPANLVFHDSSYEDRLSGKGTWSLKEGVAGTEVEIVFDRLGDRQHGYGMRVRTSGEGSSLRLFLWVEEEGGARYEFQRQ